MLMRLLTSLVVLASGVGIARSWHITTAQGDATVVARPPGLAKITVIGKVTAIGKTSDDRIIAPGAVANDVAKKPVVRARLSRSGPDRVWHSSPSVVLAKSLPGSTRSGRRTGRADFIADLQTELRRSGCYSGSISGKWTTASRQALERALHRANARLPSDKPELVHLALLRNGVAIRCGGGGLSAPETASGGVIARQRIAMPIPMGLGGPVATVEDANGLGHVRRLQKAAPKFVKHEDRRHVRITRRSKTHEIENLLRHPLGQR